jgi:hypothetical protein
MVGKETCQDLSLRITTQGERKDYFSDKACGERNGALNTRVYMVAIYVKTVKLEDKIIDPYFSFLFYLTYLTNRFLCISWPYTVIFV